MLYQTKIAHLSGPSPFGLDTQVCVYAHTHTHTCLHVRALVRVRAQVAHTHTRIRGFLSITHLGGARQGTPAVQENWNVDRHEHLCV